MSSLKSVKKVLIWIERTLIPNVATAFFLISCLMMFVEAMSRKMFNHSFAVAEEIICYSLVWAVFLSLAESGRTDRHIRVSLILESRSPATRKFLNWVNTACGLVYTLILTASALDIIPHLKQAMIVSYSPLRIPLWITFLAILLGGVLLSFYYLEKMVRVLTNQEDTIES
jgi:TRAP-type C4-dicarboxylate transport system permease small subunit